VESNTRQGIIPPNTLEFIMGVGAVVESRLEVLPPKVWSEAKLSKPYTPNPTPHTLSPELHALNPKP
jgi:hypothetical protein